MQEIPVMTQVLLVDNLRAMSTTIHQRIKQLREAKSLSMQQLGEALGVAWQTVQQWESARSAPKRARLVDVAEALGTTVEYLSFGGDGSADFDQNVAPASFGDRRIPLINYVQAGQLTEVGASFAGEAMDYLLTDMRLSEHAFALEIQGTSMLPDFPPGDRVIVDQEIAPLPGDFVVAKNGEEEATFKKYRPRGINERGVEIFELVPLNEDFPSLYSDRQPLQIIATMVEHRKYRRR